MYTIEMILQNTAMSVSLQYKAQEDALSAYNQALDSLKSGTPAILQLSCELPQQKTVNLKTSEIIAVNMYDKSSTSASGRQPGFFTAE